MLPHLQSPELLLFPVSVTVQTVQSAGSRAAHSKLYGSRGVLQVPGVVVGWGCTEGEVRQRGSLGRAG